MSLRTAKKPIEIPKGVEVNLNAGLLKVKGPKDTLELKLSHNVLVELADGSLQVALPNKKDNAAITGTTCAHIKNMLTGVTTGFKKELELVGVGYRAQKQGDKLSLSLGFSHPVVFEAPKGVTIECPSQTEIVVSGADKQKVGQAAAVIRGFRPPEPYKGKGVKYKKEQIVRKETKKK